MGDVAPHLEHVAVWCRDLERMRRFYVEGIGGTSGPLYENPATGFRSHFVSFGGGARLELMSRPVGDGAGDPGPAVLGYAHVAFRLGGREAVEEAVARLESRGVAVTGRPRLTGDGYFEAVIEDPEGNRVELMA